MLRPAAPPVKYKTLIIVESPSKCRTIEKYLGAAYTCIASCGHLREIANGLAGTGVGAGTIDEPTYAAIPKKMHYIRQIKTAIAECNGTVILGTDADREGEAIAWHICQLFHLPVDTTPRIVFREITREALECAIRNPRVIDMALVRAQQARQILDLLIGYKTTPLLWGAVAAASVSNKYNYANYKKNGTTPALSAGRCQTPALRLVYDSDLAATAAAASPNYAYNCNAYFTGQNIAFSHSQPIELENIAAFLSFYAPPTSNTGGGCNRVAIQHIFSLDAVKRIAQAPPSALKTSTLQQVAGTILHFSPVDTMACAQSLYEKGFITYHRTDETRTSDEFRASAAAYVAKTWGHDHAAGVSQTIHSTAQSTAQSSPTTSSPHEGIRPIHVALSADKAKILHRSELSANECRLYHLIWIRAVQSCMTPATCDKLTARIGARRRDANEDCTYAYTYVYDAYKPVFAGWRAVDVSGTEADINGSTDNFESTNTEKRENPFHTGYKTYFDFLSNMRNGSIIPYNQIKCTTVLRSGAGRRYTEGGLVHRLEGLGIGRPSTFAAILHKLQKREYIVRRDVIRNIGTNFDCVNYSIAADGELKVAGPKLGSGAGGESADAEFEFGTERNKLQLTDSGRVVIDTLMRCCAPLFAYDYTKRMEDELDAVAMGTRDWRHVCRDCYDTITRCLDDAASVATTASAATAEPATAGTGVLRAITKYASVRDGKYGAYIFYKTPKMKTPKFISLKGFSRNALTCDESLLSEWIDEH